MLIDQALDILWHFHILLDIMVMDLTFWDSRVTSMLGRTVRIFERFEILSETEMNPLH